MSDTILLAIHPEYWELIKIGKKVFEFRRIVPKNAVNRIVFYVTTPIRKIVGYANIKSVLVGSPTKLWARVKHGAGVPKSFFDDYFSGCPEAYAFELNSVYRLSIPLQLLDIRKGGVPPQSFSYLSQCEAVKLFKKRTILETSQSSIFLGGIHGVGKSSLCEKIFIPFGYECFTASQLIKTSGGTLRKDKAVENLDQNQALLVSRVRYQQKKSFRFLLDGHFVLKDINSQLQKIPLEVFRCLKLTKLILLTGNEQDIAQRLNKRDGQRWEVGFLQDFQNIEREHAHFISQELGIPLLVCDIHNSLNKIKKFLYNENIYT